MKGWTYRKARYIERFDISKGSIYRKVPYIGRFDIQKDSTYLSLFRPRCVLALSHGAPVLLLIVVWGGVVDPELCLWDIVSKFSVFWYIVQGLRYFALARSTGTTIDTSSVRGEEASWAPRLCFWYIASKVRYSGISSRVVLLRSRTEHGYDV